MASDAAYAAFLDKANEGLNQPTSQSSDSKNKLEEDSGFIPSKTLDVDKSQIPSALSIDAFYTSETDEPFVPVVLACDHWPSEEEFSRLVHGASSTAQVSILPTSQFKGQEWYSRVLEAVRTAAGGEQEERVYRVQHDSARVEYWLLSLKDSSTLLGLKARAIET